MATERIDLDAPLSDDFQPVVRLIIGGIAERADLGFEDLDDLQLAVERLLAEAGSQERVLLTFEIGDRSIRTLIGPLRESAIAEALQGPEPAPGELTLRRILRAVVDSFGIEQSDGGDIVVRLEKVTTGP